MKMKNAYFSLHRSLFISRLGVFQKWCEVIRDFFYVIFNRIKVSDEPCGLLVKPAAWVACSNA